MHRLFLLAIIASALSASQAHSVNLHRKHGPGWDCSYITTGTPYKDACLACEAQGKQFDQRGDSGICVGGGTPNFPSPRDADYGRRESPRQPQFSTPSSRPQQSKRLWGALSGSVNQRSDGGVDVAIAAVWNYQSESEAIEAARARCQNQGGRNCKATAFQGGCGYIARGESRTSAGYGSGTTQSEAIATCQSQGLTCPKVIGGCNQ